MSVVCRCILALGLVLLNFTSSGIPNLRFKHYTVENGLAVNAVCCFYQDSQGFMWIGTISGLNRFDGRTFKQFDQGTEQHSSLMGNIIFSIVEDDNKTLWIGTDLGVMLFDLRTERFKPFDLKTSSGVMVKSRTHSIIIDRQKQVWIATLGQGLFRYNAQTRILKQFRNDPNSSGSIASNNLRRLYEDRQGVIWIASFDRGIDRLDYRQETFTHYLPYGRPVEMRDDNFLEDSRGNLWIGNFNNGLAKLDRKTGKFSYYLTPNDKDHILHIRSIVEYQPGTLLLASDDGLTFFDVETGKSKTVKVDQSNPDGLNDSYLQALFIDRDKGLWVGSYFGGINYSTPLLNNFEHYSSSSSLHPFPGKVASVMCEDNDGNIWMGTDDAGLILFDVKREAFRQYLPQKGKNSLSYKNIHALLYDDNRLWIGTFSGGLDVLDLKTGRFKNYKSTENEKSLYYSSVYALYKDRSGTIWVGTPLGLNRYNRKEDNFDRIKELYLAGISDIVQDAAGDLWVATGGKGLFRLDGKTKRWQNYLYIEGKKGTVQSNKVSTLCLDGSNRLWVGSDGAGVSLFNFKTGCFDRVLTNLPSNIIHKIVADKEVLWISTNKGLVKFDTKTKVVNVYNKSDGLQSDQFSPNSGLKVRSGKIYFGGINGFNSFYPDRMKENMSSPVVQLTDLYLFSKRVSPNDEDAPIAEAASYAKEIVLNHTQSVVGFEFVALNYATPSKNHYTYILEGYDKDWVEVRGEPHVTYTKLPPGKYTFRVRAANGDGTWSKSEVEVKVRVRPPFWRSNLAYAFYLLLLVWLGITLQRRFRNRIERAHIERIKQLEVEKEKELYDSKIEFFTNIVHEIRTPLTLILGPLEYVIKSKKHVDEVHEDLLVVKRNSNRLLSLVNQLLDFRKIEAGGMYLKFEVLDANRLVDGVVQQFESAAKLKGVAIVQSASSDGALVNVDVEAFTKVMVNILSNALKFTKSRICIEVNRVDGLRLVEIKVSDDGIGVPLAEQENIFKPFYQIKNGTYLSEPGTGVGLSLTKSLVDLLKGELLLQSVPDEGTTFVVRIPLAEDMVYGGETVPDTATTATVLDEGGEYDQKIEPSRQKSLPKVLVVDDNEEMQQFIAQQLSNEYLVVCASSGEDAVKLMVRNSFDVVVSDVMMPEMDGYELCKRVKASISTSHIPLILLTAKCSISDKVEGLECGADAFIEKPFSTEHLMAQIGSLLRNRDVLKEKFSNMPFVSTTSIALSKADEQFMERLTSLIVKNLSDPDLSIEMLAHEMCLSRTSFFSKLKGVAGLTPNDFIRLIRLKRAAELLAQGEYRINEICFLVGFNSPSYFAKCFQKQFGMLPNDFAKGRG